MLTKPLLGGERRKGLTQMILHNINWPEWTSWLYYIYISDWKQVNNNSANSWVLTWHIHDWIEGSDKSCTHVEHKICIVNQCRKSYG